MSRAFVKEDDRDHTPELRFSLPAVSDPGYAAAAALALLDAAYAGQISAGEAATGYRWGDPALRAEVRRVLEAEQAKAEPEQDRRLIQVARRYLRAR
jgi:predicted NodU family carbamoyl transferase